MRKINLLLGLALSCSVATKPLVAQPGAAPASHQASPSAQETTVPPKPVAPAVQPPDPAAPVPSTEANPPASGKKGSSPSPTKPPVDSKSAFIIGPEDTLAVRVWDEPNLSGAVTVGPDGMISLQLIHEVKAAGLTPSQLEASLTEQLKSFRNNPEVSVQVLTVRSRKYLIQGGVNRTGTFPLTGPTTMLEALVNGGGFREFANPKKIYILRTKPDGTTEKLKFNYKDVSQGKHMEQNILVQNGDQIFVPE
ncbi:MAG: polysaccharide export protein [Bryobacterales bacterium]|nr:polysaccharide export protein [Bryobacterales bacterium]